MKKHLLFILLLLPMLADAQFIGTGRRIKPGAILTETDPTVSAASKAIGSTDVTNWNTAFGWGNHASAGYASAATVSSTYFPIVGSTLTGTAGAGFVGLPVQSSNPSTPSGGNRIFSNSVGNLSWKVSTDNFARVLSTTAALTADRTYTFPDASGEVMISGPTQTMSGAKTFSSTITSATILPNADNTRTLGNSSTQYQTTYARNILGNALFLSTTGSTNMTFGINSGATMIGTWYSNGNLLVQTGGTQTDGGFKFDVTGTSRLNGNATLGGDFLPDGDNTRAIGSTTLRMGSVYAINVSKGNTNNSFNLTTTGSTGMFFRAQPTTNNIVIQQAATAPSETNYRLTVDGTNSTAGALLVTNGHVNAPQYRLSALNAAPSSATDTGTTGEIRVTSGFIYVCTATNTWVRAALSTW